MNASVVICAYTMDRWDALIAAINSCLEQSPAPNEIVLVIDHNDDLLAQASLKATGVRVVPNRFAKGLSGARNTGVEESTGDVVVFLDDDAYADRGWLEALMRPLHDERVAGVGGWILPHWETAEPEWFPESFLWTIGCSYAGLPSSNSVIRNPIGASMAIRRRVFDRVGGFTSGLGRIGRIPLGGEETELCIRYNAIEPLEHFVLRRDAIVHHRVPSSRLTWHYFLDPLLGRGALESSGLVALRNRVGTILRASSHVDGAPSRACPVSLPRTTQPERRLASWRTDHCRDRHRRVRTLLGSDHIAT